MESYSRKLLVYASSITRSEKRFRSVSVAAEKIAKLLKLPMEVVTFGEEFSPIYVYYKNGNDEPIPIYCDKGGESAVHLIYKALRNMMFVLSFHPKHSTLKQVRKEVMVFS